MAVRQVSTESLNGNGAAWLDLLPTRKLFFHLREHGGSSNGGNVVCVIRENLFVWCQAEKGLLTMNLKRLSANPNEDIFQTLHSTLEDFPDNDDFVMSLVPESSGRFIALHCKRGLAVLKLHYYRGEHGEFSGGGKSVFCRTVRVFLTRDIPFTINEGLTLIQVSWYPSTPDTLALLTSDSFIRLFNLAEPEIPLLELSLLSAGINLAMHNVLKLEEECIVGFSLWKGSAFVFHDSGDVSLVSLLEHSRPQWLSMHPQDTENYISSSYSILVLETTPLVVVLAGKSGMYDLKVCHCVYLEESDMEAQDGGTPSREAQRLYVVESININFQSKEGDGDMTLRHDVTLLRDPANPHGYFLKHPEGVHSVHMPWLKKLEIFTHTDMSTLISEAKCEVNYLIGTVPNFTSLQGLSIVWEPRLGYALVGLTSSDMECLTLALREQNWVWDSGELQGGDFVDWWSPHKKYSSGHQRSSAFEKLIQDILHPPKEEFFPALKYHKDTGSESQADCLQFLLNSIKQLRRTYIIRQHLALKETEKKVALSNRKKEHIISEIAKLRDERDVIEEESETLQAKMKKLLDRNKWLLQRVKKLACRVEVRPPMLSEAEECMMKEMEGLRDYIEKMKLEVHVDKGKLRLCVEMDASPKVDLNAAQSSSLLKRLMDNGDKIKMLASMVKHLCEVMPT